MNVCPSGLQHPSVLKTVRIVRVAAAERCWLREQREQLAATAAAEPHTKPKRQAC